ncbi:TetR-like C-terminal domain-containing protein [Amphibacillus cookii]|uniref:TetR-like C-terminal domain-containing protein n=1 Tax=Amphibacillus cookii TaxID=767787 RepID=UPI001EF7F077|nr:TetR-like C-terminal domain-containing protein [Amphibacillus cookii]
MYTKQALANALKDTLSIKPLDKITVKELVQVCNLNRQTFYYHFQDIYALLAWIYKTEAIGAIKDCSSHKTWKQGLTIILNYMADHKRLCINTYRSLAREHLEMSLNQVLYDLLVGVIDEMTDSEKLSESDKQFILQFYSHAFTGILIDWIKDEMNIPTEKMVDSISLLMDGQFGYLIEKLK